MSKLSPGTIKLLAEMDQIAAKNRAEPESAAALVVQKFGPLVVERMRAKAANLPDMKATMVAMFEASLSSLHSGAGLLSVCQRIEKECLSEPPEDAELGLEQMFLIFGLVNAYRDYVAHWDAQHAEETE